MTRDESSQPVAFGVPSSGVPMMLLVLAALLFLPPLVFYLTNADSHSTGLSLACVLIIALLSLQMKPRVPWLTIFAVVAVISVHAVVATLFRPIVFERTALSLILLAIVLTAASFLSSWLLRQRDDKILITLDILRYVMIVIAILSATGIQPAASRFVGQPVFPFTEPSHFALIFAVLLAQACFTYQGIRRYAWLALGLALGLGLQSLSMVVAVLLIAVVCLPWWQLIGGIVAAASLIELLDTKYYTDRLDFGAHTTNQSALVYLQGWELATDAFHRSSGWGIGFQQLGFGNFTSPSADVLFRLYRVEANIFDGGFVAAKLASEFGVFGLGLIALYVAIAGRTAIGIRRHIRHGSDMSAGMIFASAIILCYSIDMFVRGVGYFSASSALFMTALLFMAEQRKRKIG